MQQEILDKLGKESQTRLTNELQILHQQDNAIPEDQQ
jgi:hypothetical protein